MTADISQQRKAGTETGLMAVLEAHDARIRDLEQLDKKGVLRRISESASLSALFLGLILTFLSLYDALITKPEADRVNRISEFNKAVNSAAKLRGDVIQAEIESKDPRLFLAMSSSASSQIFNNIATARALLRDLRDQDVGIPQLNILTTESFNFGDLESAKVFVSRAVNKTDAAPFLRSEAKRFEGKYFFRIGDPNAGRKSFQAALDILGNVPAMMAARAYILSDLVLTEYHGGFCDAAAQDFQTIAEVLSSPQVGVGPRSQMATTLKEQVRALGGHPCPAPPNLDSLGS